MPGPFGETGGSVLKMGQLGLGLGLNQVDEVDPPG